MAMSDTVPTKMSKSFDSVELTEALVLTRTRAPDLDSVKKLNCWASNIGDVSVVRRMPALEVCSLSINKITSLRDFAHCHNLKELYVRTNKIERLGDIHYLKHLRKLRSLWLSENPCAAEPNYRMTVLKTLPNLRKLDNIVVTEDEVHQAETDGEQIPVPEDFSSSSLFHIGTFNQNNTKASASPPDSARSVDSSKSVADSVGVTVGTSVENSVVDSVNVFESDGRWALPRRKRQQRKREEMLRSSGGEEGGGSARSSEDSSGAGDGIGKKKKSPQVSSSSDSHPEEKSPQVSSSSDSHPEEENGEGFNKKIAEDDEQQDKDINADYDIKSEEGALENSSATSKGSAVSSHKNSISDDNRETLEDSVVDREIDVQSSNREAEEKSFPLDNDLSCAMDKNVSGDLSVMPETEGSINVLRINDLEETDHSRAVLSNNSTLVSGKEAQGGDGGNASNNNNNDSSLSSSVQKQGIDSNSVIDKKPVTAGQTSTELTGSPKPSRSSPVKQSERSLLDQIRLDDSLDVLDSASEEKGKNPVGLPDEGVSSIDLEDLEIEIEQAKVLSGSDQSREMPTPRTYHEPKVTAAAASVKNSRPKPPLPIKTKPVYINLEEHNRLRAELGVKPMDNAKSSTLPANSDVTKARNSNVLQAVLCLLKELDKDSLDIVGATVKARLEML